MKKSTLILISLFFIGRCLSQTNVFDCAIYQSTPTQNELSSSPTFFGNCVEFGNTNPIFSAGSWNNEVLASTQIHISDNFHAGGYDQNGTMHLAIDNGPSLNVAVMNYTDLVSILRYKKFELGIEMPAEVQTKISNYLLELGAQADRLNPFHEKDIDVEATFMALDEGWYDVIDGYYTRDYVQNLTTLDWDDIGTNYPFRIRYAPPKNGEWTCKIRIKINEVEVYSSKTFNFNVIESGDPGYVTVHPNNRNLMRGDRMIYPAGQNFPHVLDGTAWPSNPIFSLENYEKASLVDNWNNYHNFIEDYFEQAGQGPKFIRTIQAPWASLIEFEKRGNYYDRLHYAWEQDKLLDMCDQYDALMMFNLMIHEPFMEYGDFNKWQWDWNHHIFNDSTNSWTYEPLASIAYCYNPFPEETGGKKPHEMFTNEDDLEYHEQRTRYYIARYGYSTKIYCFELLSEPFHMDEFVKASYVPYLSSDASIRQPVHDAIVNYSSRMSSFIKTHMNHWQHLIAAGAYRDAYPNDFGITDTSYRIPAIDIVTMSHYSPSAQKYLIQGHDDSDLNNWPFVNENTFYGMVRYFGTHDEFNDTSDWKKPVLAGECDHKGSNGFDCAGLTSSNIDGMCMGFTGLAGFNLWAGGLDYDESPIWLNSIKAANHLNGDDVIDVLSNSYGGWIQGRQQETIEGQFDQNDNVNARELQYYLASDQESAVGYVRNRTYNLYTNQLAGNPCDFGTGNSMITHPQPLNNAAPIQWDEGNDSKHLKVVGLKNNTDYIVHWFSFVEGQYIYNESDCQNSTSWGKFELQHPVLNPYSRPILWFVLEQADCQGSGMVTQNNTQTQNSSSENVSDKSGKSDSENNFSGIVDKEQGTIRRNNVYPNPFNQKIFIETDSKDIVQLYTATGQLFGSYTVIEGKNTLHLDNLLKGVYFIKFADTNELFKLVKL